MSRNLDRDFAIFVRERKDVVKLVVRLAREEQAGGAKRLSTKRLWEQARARVARKRRRGVPSLDNSFTSRMARLLMANYREFRGCFEVRGLRT